MIPNVGIDTRMIRNTGIGTYLRGLLSGFSDLGALRSPNVCLFGDESFPARGSVQSYPFRSRIYSFSEQLEYLRLLGRCRLWHAPHYNAPFFRRGTKLVVTIHDVIHWIFRKEWLSPAQRFYAETMMRRALRHSDHIIAVSAKTRDDLIEYFDADSSKITVIHEAVHPDVRRSMPADIEKIRNKYGLSGPYFIYVGMLKPHKNVLWLIERFNRLTESGVLRSKLVIVGRKDKRYPKGYEGYSKITSGRSTVYLPQVPFEDLNALYSGALALVHPSRYEGFGLTLLEAMACETPVVALRAGSVPEIVGEAGVLVLPDPEDDLRNALVRMETDGAFRNELIRKGNERLKSFSWRKTAEETLAVYEKVLGFSLLRERQA